MFENRDASLVHNVVFLFIFYTIHLYIVYIYIKFVYVFYLYIYIYIDIYIYRYIVIELYSKCPMFLGWVVRVSPNRSIARHLLRREPPSLCSSQTRPSTNTHDSGTLTGRR